VITSRYFYFNEFSGARFCLNLFSVGEKKVRVYSGGFFAVVARKGTLGMRRRSSCATETLGAGPFAN